MIWLLVGTLTALAVLLLGGALLMIHYLDIAMTGECMEGE